ncbi:MAG: hypothetical protein AAB966_04570, partial [Patescibacteria group bacterium]
MSDNNSTTPTVILNDDDDDIENVDDVPIQVEKEKELFTNFKMPIITDSNVRNCVMQFLKAFKAFQTSRNTIMYDSVLEMYNHIKNNDKDFFVACENFVVHVLEKVCTYDVLERSERCVYGSWKDLSSKVPAASVPSALMMCELMRYISRTIDTTIWG